MAYNFDYHNWRCFYNYEYPYTDSGRYNSDWILSTIKKLVSDFLTLSQNFDTLSADVNNRITAISTDVNNRLTAQDNKIENRITAISTDVNNRLTAQDNKIESNRAGLQSQFDGLKAYVDNYFANLNIEQEVKDAIDEMAKSGELAQAIAPYLGYVTPQMYGGVGDGVTNNTKALQDAMNNPMNLSVFLPNGAYVIKSSITVPGNKSFIGSDPTGSYLVVSADFTDNTSVLLLSSRGEQYIENIGIVSSEGNTYVTGIEVSSHGVKEFNNIYIYGKRFSTGIYIHDNDYTYIDKLYLNGTQYDQFDMYNQHGLYGIHVGANCYVIRISECQIISSASKSYVRDFYGTNVNVSYNLGYRNGITIESSTTCTIINSNITAALECISLIGNNVEISHCSLINPWNSMIILDGSAEYKISNNTFQGLGATATAIDIKDVSDALITGNYIENILGTAVIDRIIAGGGIVFSNNIVRNFALYPEPSANTVATSCGIWLDNTSVNAITGNVFLRGAAAGVYAIYHSRADGYSQAGNVTSGVALIN